MTVYILSSLVMPCRDDYFVIECKRIGLSQAKEILKDGFVSAVGHEATAKVLTELLGYDIKLNRIFVDMRKGDKAVAIQFLKRLDEGKILNEKEILDMLKKGLIEFRLIVRVL